jgi:GT2 family glycosyltransferase
MRDAVRTLRGKRPKYSALAQQLLSEQQLACFAAARSAGGICTVADVQWGILSADEFVLFKSLINTARGMPGPIVQFGTLLGETTDIICRWKSPDQRVITVDSEDANPWNLSPVAYRALIGQMLKNLLAVDQVVHLTTSVRDLFTTYCGAPPALVFVNFVRSYEEARDVLQWAQATGAQTIAGRGYDYASPGIMRAVDEFGGPDVLEGSVWRLNQRRANPQIDLPEKRAIQLVPDGATAGKGLVSILTPVYNGREFIETTLEDVSRQLYRDWELIVIEDGSANDIEETIERFTARHIGRRIVYHRKLRNAGVSTARNDAIALSRGEFVAFLDADDRWSPDHLQRKVRLLCESGCDLAYSRVEMFDSQSGQTLCTWGPSDDELRYFPESMFGRPYLQPSGVVVRASLLADVGKFDESLAYAEDYDYWFRAINLGKRFYFDPKVTSRYRKNHASAATTDRLVLCYDGVARVSCRYLSLPGGDAQARRRIVAKHFLTAGTGHLAFRPSSRNGCNPQTAKDLLQEACRLEVDRRDGLKYYWLARFALATGTRDLFRRFFHRKYKRCVG